MQPWWQGANSRQRGHKWELDLEPALYEMAEQIITGAINQMHSIFYCFEAIITLFVFFFTEILHQLQLKDDYWTIEHK